MNRNMYMIARPTDWNVLEDFYKDIDGGLEKVESMKKFCKIEQDDGVVYEDCELQYASVNYQFLYDRRHKLNGGAFTSTMIFRFRKGGFCYGRIF